MQPAASRRSPLALANAAEWMAREAGMWSFECRNHSLRDLTDTAERWHKRNVAIDRPKAVDTTAHFAPAQHSHPVFQT